MKLTKSILILGFLLSAIGALYAQKSNIRTYNLTVHAQNSQLGGNMVDMDKGHAYPLEEASYNPKRIDFGLMYGRNTGGNLMAPISGGFLTFGDKFKDALLAWGNDRNNSTFINLGNIAKAQEIFDSVKSAEAIEELYKEWFDKIVDLEGYDPGKNGPSQRMRNMTIGDVLLFRSENKDTHHILRIVRYVQSTNGLIEFEVKSPKNVKKKKK